MTFLSSKWTITVFVLLIILLILFVVGKKSVHTSIAIQATPDEVWNVLTDFSKVKEWNQVLVPMNGELKERTKIKYEFYQEIDGKSAIIDATVKQVVPNKLINQNGGIPGVLTFDHQYILEENPTGTQVYIHEEYRGIMVPFWNPDPVEKAYSRLLRALKGRVETLQ